MWDTRRIQVLVVLMKILGKPLLIIEPTLKALTGGALRSQTDRIEWKPIWMMQGPTCELSATKTKMARSLTQSLFGSL